MFLFYPIFVFLNVITVLLTYILLCNTAIIVKDKQDNGHYILDRKYVIGDMYRPNRLCGFTCALLLAILSALPFTWVVCVVLWVYVIVGYCSGKLDVFCKNKLI